jgi:hypothetical protein
MGDGRARDACFFATVLLLSTPPPQQAYKGWSSTSIEERSPLRYNKYINAAVDTTTM